MEITEKGGEKLKRKILVFALLLSLVTTLIPTTTYTFLTTSAATTDTGWTLVTNARALKGYPDLAEYIWQKNATMAPNGLYDKIGLHRLIQTDTKSKGVVFINPGTYGSGESLISNPTTDNYTKIENESQAIYWANRGFDVYAIDYRTHFVPATLNTSQLGFMANWGWDQWISDIKEAVNKAKETSGVAEVFMAGQSFGGRATMNYATVYSQDVKGIILLDGGNASANPAASNSYNLTAALNQENATANWALITPNLPGRTPVTPTFQALMQYALANPTAPAEAPPGTPLPPVINPLTNKTWSNITEWCAYVLNGSSSNILGGYSNISTIIRAMAGMDRYWPDRLNLEQNAINDWNNCPYVTYDFDDHYKDVQVPLIGFTSELFGLDRYGTIGNILNPDVTRIFLKGYGHMDVFMGTYSARDVNEPVYRWMINHSPSGWTLINDARAMKAYPDLKEYIWQKNATMPPNGQYDKIGLHRLVKPGITPIGVIFMTDCPNWGAGEQHISNPPADNWTKYENYSSAIYWANRGFDVYAIDYRTHFVPKDLTSTQMSFVANWTWDMWISDIKEAANKVKEVSGNQKFYIEGQCSGGEAALNYATKYWKDDLEGIILLDAFYPGLQGYPIVGRITETNTYNLTKAIIDMNAAGNWSSDTLRTVRLLANYALQNPDAPASYPPGTPLNPPINPITNKTWTNITEWFTWLVQNSFGSTTTPPGIFSNLMGGYGNISQDEFCLANNEFLPMRLFIENKAMTDWVNCPYLSYDFNDHYNEIGVPVLAFEGPYANQTGTFRFVQGTNNTDFTGNYLPMYGHLDIFCGTYSARDVSEPAYQWMVNHLPRTLFGNTAIGTVYDQNDPNAQSVSYFTCTKSGTITDIRAYVDGASAGNCIAALYAVSEGSASILLAQSKPVSIGTSFSWVDFQLPTPYHVIAGTKYGLAIMGDVPVNVMEVDGTGQRDHNAVSTYAEGFANPFGPIWGTDDRGAMSIYAFAISTNEEHVDIGGVSIIDVPGHPNIMITASHMDRSNFYSGSAVRIMLFVSTAPSGIGPPFKFVVAYENNPERYAFSQQVGGSIQLLNLVNKDQIQVLGKDKTALVYWTVPMAAPATTTNPFGAATPAVTIPPGWLLLQGYGDTQSNAQSTTYPSLWTWNYQTTVYNAKSTFICPDWQYFGPVAETGTSPTVVTEATNNWTHP